MMHVSNTVGTLNCMHDPIDVLTSEDNVNYLVRKLMPIECGRLQGFPDDWTEGVPGSESAQYKMWGNGMCLLNMLYIFEGLADALRSEKRNE